MVSLSPSFGHIPRGGSFRVRLLRMRPEARPASTQIG
jgi:hypothetical protein